MARRYSPTEWKIKKHYDATHVEYIGNSYYFAVSVYLIKINGKFRFIMYNNKNQCICELKHKYDDNTEFEDLGNEEKELERELRKTVAATD